MKIEVVYVFPAMNGSYLPFAERFVASCLENSPLVEHSNTVVCNGSEPDVDAKSLFSLLPNVRFLRGDNSAYDISAYQQASQQSNADLIVFFGASAYLRKPGWLLAMASAFQRHGEAQYGCMGNRGDANVGVSPHIRTTGFWTTPRLFNNYPHRIERPDQRHPFEHGPDCFSSWVDRCGFKNWVVTYGGDYLWGEWDSHPEGFHRGAQANLISGDHLTEPPYYAVP